MVKKKRKIMKVLIIDGKEYLHGRNVAIEYKIPYSTFKKYLYESNIDYELFSGSHWYKRNYSTNSNEVFRISKT